MSITVQHSGKVIDQFGMPLIGAHIVLDAPISKGTISDFDGNFIINGTEGELWKIGHLGKETRTVTLKKGMPYATYVLRDEGIVLDEVVVTAPKKNNNKNWATVLGLSALALFGYKYFNR